MELLKKQNLSALLGLAFDGSRLEMVAVRRTNGGVTLKKSSSASLSLDALTDDPDLVGREIRKHLEAAGIRERRCVVCLPLSWVLSVHIQLPELTGADLESYMQVEAERGLPYDPATLMLACSRYTPGEEKHATLFAISREHLERVQAVLGAAQLRPVSFSVAISALQPAPTAEAEPVMALLPGENSAALEVAGSGGIAMLRQLEGIFELENGEKQIQPEQVAREVRITLGQLPAGLRDRIKTVRVFGAGDWAESLAEQLVSRVQPLGLRVEQVRSYGRQEAGLKVPTGTPVSGAVSLAVRRLAGQAPELEFLPPKPSAWQKISSRYSSGKLVWAGALAGAVVLLFALGFGFQQWQLSRWGSQWAGMKDRVAELESLQQQIRLYRPWFDESCRSLSILRRLTEAFPEDGAVTAKTVEMRDPMRVTCSGVARDHLALLKTLDQLRATREISAVQVEQIRGKSPEQFTFSFHWGEQTSNEH